MNSKPRTTAVFLLALMHLILVTSACQSPPDERLLHARESAEWRRFDANLNILYHARRGLRQPYILPDRPEFDGELEAAAWAFAIASEESMLACMIQQEAMNDLDHCKQALQLAEQELEEASERSKKALEDLGPTVRRFSQVFERGDGEQNRRILLRFLTQLPKYYRGALLSVVDARRE